MAALFILFHGGEKTNLPDCFCRGGDFASDSHIDTFPTAPLRWQVELNYSV